MNASFEPRHASSIEWHQPQIWNKTEFSLKPAHHRTVKRSGRVWREHSAGGSKAIAYVNEAAKLGRSEAHLRLGWLYDAAGMKDKATTEYEEFLKKKPDYGDRKKLEDYISTHLIKP